MASGDTLLSWDPLDLKQPSSNYATKDERNSYDVLDYDASTDESAIARDVLPANYAGGGLTLKIHWMATSATTGDVVWNAAIERHQAGTDDQDSDSFASAQAATSTTSGTSGSETVTTITFTSGAQMDSLAAGERFRLKITRDADNGSDTMAGDAELSFLHLKET